VAVLRLPRIADNLAEQRLDPRVLGRARDVGRLRGSEPRRRLHRQAVQHARVAHGVLHDEGDVRRRARGEEARLTPQKKTCSARFFETALRAVLLINQLID